MLDIRDKFADPGSERMVLSCLLHTPDTIIDVSAKLGDRDFLSPNHRALYSILTLLYKQGVKTFDLMAVVNAATDKGVISLIGGPEYIDALLSSLVDKRNLSVYLSKVLDSSTKYRLYFEATNVQESLLANVGFGEGSLTAEDLISQAESRFLEVALEAKQIEDAQDISIGLKEHLDFLASNPTDVRGLSTGIVLLDESLNGLLDGTLTIVAARQKGGKSTLLMNMAANIAYVQKKPTLYIDTEINRSEMQVRLISYLSQVPERIITNGKFIENNQWAKAVGQACDVVSTGRFYHKYIPGFNLDNVKNMVRKFHAREGIASFFFDYIKIPDSMSSDNFKEHQLLGNITTGLKDLAGALNIPGVAAAQIKRGDTTKPKTRFHDSDVADSDRIGRYCDSLIALGMKSNEEREKDGEMCGTHRAQVLLARRGRPSFHGIDLACNFPRYTLTQAKHQSSGLSSFQEESIF